MQSDMKIAAGWVSAVIALASLPLLLGSCKDTGQTAAPPQAYGTIVTIPKGAPTYAAADTRSASCGPFVATMSAIVRQQAPGGWFAIDTDDYSRGADPTPACLKLPYIWVKGKS